VVKRIFQGVGVLVLLALVVMAVAVVKFDKGKDELLPIYGQAPSQFITLENGAVAHVRDQGQADGPALVLVHGSNASLHTWEPWVGLLGDKYRIVTLDMPGHGLTGAVPGDDYSRDAMVAFTHEVVGQLGLTSYAIGGNSMGGGIAFQYAEDYPSEVTALILVDASGLPRKVDPDAKVPLGFRIARLPVINKVFQFVAPRAMYEEGVRKVFVDQSKVTTGMIDRYYDLNLYDGNRRATGIRFALPYGGSELADKAGEITVPTLIMWGDKDGLIPVEFAYEFEKLIPNTTLAIYENVGHIPMEEVPERSAADVDAFLSAALAAAPAAEAVPEAPNDTDALDGAPVDEAAPAEDEPVEEPK
jgi:pimeloyl-ACP methyl ester carboxylesterase